MSIDKTAGKGRRHYLTVLLLGCTALAPASLLAQQSTEDDLTVLAPITLEGQGDNDANSVVAYSTSAGSKLATPILDIPASVSVVTAKEIEQRGARTTEEVLRYTTGVATDFYGGDDRFDYYKLRGFDASVYRDGQPMQKAFGGIREDAFAYERVEIVKGGNSTVNGPSEPGGIVNFVTKLPRTERFGEAYVTGGSFGHAEAGVDFGDNLTPDATLSYRLTARVQKSDKELDYSRDDATLVMGGLTWRPTGQTILSVVADYLDRDGSTGSGWPLGTDFSRDVFFGEPDFNYVDNTRRAISVMLDHDFGNGLTFNANARYQNEDRGFGYVYIWDADGLNPADRYYFANAGSGDQLVADANLQYDASFGSIQSRTLVGLQYSDVESDSRTWYTAATPIDYTNPVYTGGIDLDVLDPFTGTKADDRVASVYLQEELTFSDRFIATFGLRHDRMDLARTDLAGIRTSADFSKTTHSLGLTWKITPDLSAYASYAESVLPAALTVEPEEGEQVEMGVKYRPAGMNALLTAAVYDLRKTNITRTDAGSNPPIQRTIGEIRARGLELEARAELPGDLDVIAAYSYTDTEITDPLSPYQGNSLGNVPRHLASVWLDYTLAGNDRWNDMTFGIGARYKGTAYGGDDNTTKSEAAVLIDAAYSYDIAEDTRLAINVTNLLDEKHREAASGAITYNPGREVGVTLRRTW
ncbi:TonB-dependent siderophore receptor [Paracoccus benzoatiresistens]|uniref:TonB-dependent siderophore receptor n=1 Tax=Paracoccus benzoatiresistens TaxID=2997341 RepID=A0ABT4J2L3_9RHOB|nr:TonB-dependent siderophore receptor [Paracoccus sp. EF6]MCZ0961349.1 TonB-dependent siderophore receptor [Paracoccus sp. EF6]